MSVRKLQVNIAGYRGLPCTILLAISDSVLYFSKQITYSSDRLADDFMCLTYSPSSSGGDFCFTDKDLSKSIALAFELFSINDMASESNKAFVFLPEIGGGNKFDPRQSVQLDRVTENGVDYRLNIDISNENVAFLCAVWAFKMMEHTDKIKHSSGELDDFQDGFYSSSPSRVTNNSYFFI